jgi:hypothetical protein
MCSMRLVLAWYSPQQPLDYSVNQKDTWNMFFVFEGVCISFAMCISKMCILSAYVIELLLFKNTCIFNNWYILFMGDKRYFSQISITSYTYLLQWYLWNLWQPKLLKILIALYSFIQGNFIPTSTYGCELALCRCRLGLLSLLGIPKSLKSSWCLCRKRGFIDGMQCGDRLRGRHCEQAALGNNLKLVILEVDSQLCTELAL